MVPRVFPFIVANELNNEVVLDNSIRVLEWPDKLYPNYSKQTPGRAIYGTRYWRGSILIGPDADSWPDYIKVDKKSGHH